VDLRIYQTKNQKEVEQAHDPPFFGDSLFPCTPLPKQLPPEWHLTDIHTAFANAVAAKSRHEPLCLFIFNLGDRFIFQLISVLHHCGHELNITDRCAMPNLKKTN
jgi:hypothetical protein